MDVPKIFQVAITKADLIKMENDSVVDYNKNSLGEIIYKCRKLRGDWINCIRKQINEFERTNYSIIGNVNN